MNKIINWWLSINWRTRSISIMILIISIFMSTITFIFFLHLQNQLNYTNLRFFRDFSAFLAYDITNNLQDCTQEEIKNVLEKIYLTTASLDYLQLFNYYGNKVFSFPSDSSFSKDLLVVHLIDFSFGHSNFFLNLPTSISIITVNSSINHCIIPLFIENRLFGFLQLGFISSSSYISITKFVQLASILIFVFVWLMFILGLAFNFFIIVDPIKELLIGLHYISLGKFGYTINTFVKGMFGNLIISFNGMSERLQVYEKNNISELTSEKRKLESFVSTISDGAILLDAELRIILVNHIAIKVFQWFNKDLIGSIIFHHLPIHVYEALLPIINNIVKFNYLDNHNIQSQELIINLNNESLKTFRFLFSTILSDDRQCFNGVVLIIEDITRENQLNQAKNQFISNISHELRTPLCNIGSFLETLIDYDYKLTFNQKSQFLEIAHAETQRLNSLVNDILDLSRLESENNYILKPVLLINTIIHIVKASQLVALSKQVRIIIELHSNVKEVFAHQSSLSQILSNLVSNSLKFTHKQGKIVVRVYPLNIINKKKYLYNLLPQVIRLEVIDEGIGIKKIFQKQIFDRFMRIENNIHTFKGTGLGLSIVKNIVKKHNSVINLYSEVNIGTSFWFDLVVVSS